MIVLPVKSTSYVISMSLMILFSIETCSEHQPVKFPVGCINVTCRTAVEVS